VSTGGLSFDATMEDAHFLTSGDWNADSVRHFFRFDYCVYSDLHAAAVVGRGNLDSIAALNSPRSDLHLAEYSSRNRIQGGNWT